MEESIFLSMDEEEILRRKKAAYRAVMRQKRRKKRLVKARLILAGLILFIVLIIGLLVFMISRLIDAVRAGHETEPLSAAFGGIERALEPEPVEEEVIEEPEQRLYHASEDGNIAGIGGEVVGSYVILVDKTNDRVMAGRNYKTVINPASMTKVLTLLVAVEHLSPEQLDDTFTLTFDITNYAYVHDCSTAGFAENETVTVRDLLYGTILPSGGDAAVGLATYIAGSHEAFVEMMNEKLAEMGLADTAHFTNCVGLYDEAHHCTCYDMAMIMATAMDNELCREILSARKYTTSSTPEHPAGIDLSNWFLRRIEDKDCGLTVLGGKTGFVKESGNCAVSLGVRDDGSEYVCVVAASRSAWRCIYDHVAVYQQFFDAGYVPMSEEEAESAIEEDTQEWKEIKRQEEEQR
ncbi:MAG: serine hydrolase [Lachnospiraceae bacterium]|nr:serine hydrolase [Lachnospiraceae bacterium]